MSNCVAYNYGVTFGNECATVCCPLFLCTWLSPILIKSSSLTSIASLPSRYPPSFTSCPSYKLVAYLQNTQTPVHFRSVSWLYMVSSLMTFSAKVQASSISSFFNAKKKVQRGPACQRIVRLTFENLFSKFLTIRWKSW